MSQHPDQARPGFSLLIAAMGPPGLARARWVNGHLALGHVLSLWAVRTPGEAGRQGRGRLAGLQTRVDGHSSL